MTDTATAPEVELLDLNQFDSLEGKKVNLTYKVDGETVDAEGLLMAVAPAQGIMFRKRGTQKPDLIKREQIIGISQIADAPKKVTAKKLKAVTLDEARAHLADRHGYKLSDVNSATPEQAMLAHEQIDHADLGHTHEGDEPTDEHASESDIEAAIQAGESETSIDS